MSKLRKLGAAAAIFGVLSIPAIAAAQSGWDDGRQDGWAGGRRGGWSRGEGGGWRDRPVNPGEVGKWGGGDPRGPRWRGEGPAPDGYHYWRGGGGYPGTGEYRGGGRGRWHDGRFYPYGVGSCWRWSHRRQDWKWTCY